MHYHRLAIENARDIIACGFDRSKTFIFSDLDYVGTMCVLRRGRFAIAAPAEVTPCPHRTAK